MVDELIDCLIAVEVDPPSDYRYVRGIVKHRVESSEVGRHGAFDAHLRTPRNVPSLVTDRL